MVTSTAKSEGKTFISANLAASFVLAGKKTLLIGGDIRNPRLYKFFDFQKTAGLTDCMVKEDSWKNYIIKQNKNGSKLNIDIINAGTVPPNPNELLMSPMLKKIIEEAKQEYDYVIIDSAPVGLVSDSYFINEFVDLTLYVVREEVTPKDAVNFINAQKDEGKLNNMYIVLNGSKSTSNYKYGYGKSYGYHSIKNEK